MSEGRISRRFQALKQQRRPGLVTFITAGDPDFASSMAIMRRLPAAGADIIELGMPFSDPMADGPAIQASSQRSLQGGHTMRRTLGMVTAFRQSDHETPVVLMGYYNPIYAYGIGNFVTDVRQAGVDGLIVVDLPPEEAMELLVPCRAAGLDFIFLAAPTTSDARLPTVVEHAAGFIYYVSITGITGTASPVAADVRGAVDRIRRFTSLPVAVGFGIRTAEQAQEIGHAADAAVVGSAIVSRIEQHVRIHGGATPTLADETSAFVVELSRGIRNARRDVVA